MADKTCPNCKLINPESALQCNCGYYFQSHSLKNFYLSKIRLPNGYAWSVSKKITVAFVFSLIGIVLGLFAWIAFIMSLISLRELKQGENILSIPKRLMLAVALMLGFVFGPLRSFGNLINILRNP